MTDWLADYIKNHNDDYYYVDDERLRFTPDDNIIILKEFFGW